jgi:hypothetical protein
MFSKPNNMAGSDTEEEGDEVGRRTARWRRRTAR